MPHSGTLRTLQNLDLGYIGSCTIAAFLRPRRSAAMQARSPSVARTAAGTLSSPCPRSQLPNRSIPRPNTAEAICNRGSLDRTYRMPSTGAAMIATTSSARAMITRTIVPYGLAGIPDRRISGRRRRPACEGSARSTPTRRPSRGRPATGASPIAGQAAAIPTLLVAHPRHCTVRRDNGAPLCPATFDKPEYGLVFQLLHPTVHEQPSSPLGPAPETAD
jgi:hypothetical protein